MFPEIITASSSHCLSQPLFLNPVPQERRAVPEFDASKFAQREVTHRVTIDQGEFVKIESDLSDFAGDQFLDRIHVLGLDMPGHAEHDRFVRGETFDFAAHSQLGAVTERKLQANHNRLTTKKDGLRPGW
jgi:hypothetical protein